MSPRVLAQLRHHPRQPVFDPLYYRTADAVLTLLLLKCQGCDVPVARGLVSYPDSSSSRGSR